jgi:flagellar biogenesis protein FliO
MAMLRRALMTAAILGLLLGAVVRGGDSADRESRLITPRSSDRGPPGDGKGTTRAGQKPRSAADGWWTTLGGLAAVLALIYLTARVVRKNVPAAQKTLPAEVVQVLGRKSLDYRHTIHLVRFGSRMLMLGTSQEGMRTLSEITDPVEIDYLAGLCRPSEPASVAGTFSQLFQRFQNPEPAPAASVSEPGRAAEPHAHTEIEPDSDPAILRLQERLQQAARGAGDRDRSPPSTEVAG